MSDSVMTFECVAGTEGERAARVFARLAAGDATHFSVRADGLTVEFALNKEAELEEEGYPVMVLAFVKGPTQILAHAEHDNVMLALSAHDALAAAGLDVRINEAAPERDTRCPYGPWLTRPGCSAHVLLGNELTDEALARVLTALPGIVMRRFDIVRERARLG